jgi:hypothetical protein
MFGAEKTMLASDQVEELICLVAAMHRDDLIHHIHDYRASFPLDFTDQFLASVPLERLRHIFVALCLQQQHFPMRVMPTAA